MIITKEHIGKTIYACKAAGFRSCEQELKQFRVVSVGRRYAVLIQGNGSRECKYDVESGRSEESIRSGIGSSYGYRWFESEDQYWAYTLDQKKRSEIASFFRDMSARDKLNEKQVSLIYRAIRGEGL